MKTYVNEHGSKFTFEDHDYATKILGLKLADEKKEEKPKEEESQHQEIEEMSVKDLKELAKITDIKGYSKMNRDELIEALKEGE